MSADLLELMFHRYSSAADALEEGFFRHERRGHVPTPVHIWWGPVLDPVTREPLDRAERWHVEVDGRPLSAPEQPPLLSFWPRCRRWPVDRAEYDYLVARAQHDREHDMHSPFAQASGKVDLLSASIPEIGG